MTKSFLTAGSKVLGVAVVAVVACTGIEVAVAQSEPALGTRAAALERLFTPPTATPGMYEVYESTESIDSLAALLRRQDAAPSDSAWKKQRLTPGDAFGAESSYDRWRVGRLYGGRRVEVVRGSLRNGNGTITAYTLLSPYPDPTLASLLSGTMVIVFHVPQTIK